MNKLALSLAVYLGLIAILIGVDAREGLAYLAAWLSSIAVMFVTPWADRK